MRLVVTMLDAHLLVSAAQVYAQQQHPQGACEKCRIQPLPQTCWIIICNLTPCPVDSSAHSSLRNTALKAPQPPPQPGHGVGSDTSWSLFSECGPPQALGGRKAEAVTGWRSVVPQLQVPLSFQTTWCTATSDQQPAEMTALTDQLTIQSGENQGRHHFPPTDP